ncbi:MAG: SpoVR family protein [Rhodospirillales bacterium]|jgi:stage V sporulation protein R|nr:SpoVR family protein [Rhodospirillales bacterium]
MNSFPKNERVADAVAETPALLSPGHLSNAPKPLFEGPNWDFTTLQQVHDAIEEIALGELGLDVYPNQIEVITSEQMLDAYASVGLPLMYRHWSFGKRFAHHETLYRKGLQGLAYEIVINSSPCISYIMEENSMTMQTLVIAHAAFGHNHFFKNNYLFRQWTDAEGILDYLAFSRDYISKCEERYGIDAVERVIDAAHALRDHGVNRYAHRAKPNLNEELQREEDRRAHDEANYNDLWRTVPTGTKAPDLTTEEVSDAENRLKLGLPEENLLYFIEKRAPKLAGWQRELVRIVRNIAQYFYPQKQTQLMNEGCATFCHYEIMNRLHDKGLITEGTMLEFLHSHSSVVFQPSFDDQRYSGLNPYALGFAMMCDIKRICTEPTDEDRAWFPDMAGNGDPYGTLRHAWANFRDESFVLQYLSPKLIREFRLFEVADDNAQPAMRVDAIHDELGYRRVRSALSRQYDLARREPDIQVVDVDLAGDRCLVLAHSVYNGVQLEEKTCQSVLRHISELWGYNVRLHEVDAATDRRLKTHEVTAIRA